MDTEPLTLDQIRSKAERALYPEIGIELCTAARSHNATVVKRMKARGKGELPSQWTLERMTQLLEKHGTLDGISAATGWNATSIGQRAKTLGVVSPGRQYAHATRSTDEEIRQAIRVHGDNYDAVASMLGRSKHTTFRERCQRIHRNMT